MHMSNNLPQNTVLTIRHHIDDSSRQMAQHMSDRFSPLIREIEKACEHLANQMSRRLIISGHNGRWTEL